MSELDVPSRIGGRYRPLRLIGKGGMGAVYEVEHVHTGQRLALKVLTLQVGRSVERFKLEARVAARIPSDHVVRVTDADVAPELDGAPYLVMELLEGADLARVTGDSPASPSDVVEWLRQVARALVKAHERGIVHRDLKPENLFLTRREDGTPLVKILDFGIAKMVVDTVGLTHSGQFLGTPMFMAPEQADSHGPPVTERADLYALGQTAFTLLTGRTYWTGGGLGKVFAQLLAGPMAPPSARGATFGPAFDAWFLRACNRDTSKRFTSAHEQVEELAAALGLPRQARISESMPKPVAANKTETATPAPTPHSSAADVITTVSSSRRKRWLASGIAGSLAVLGSLALLRLHASPTAAVMPEEDYATASPRSPLASSVSPAMLPHSEPTRAADAPEAIADASRPPDAVEDQR